MEVHEPVTYYVSPNGSDNNDGLSPETPLRTPQLAADRTGPGDTVYFMGGLYQRDDGKEMLAIRNSGAPGAPINFRAYADQQPVFKLLRGWNHILVRASYIVVDGITVEGNNENITLEEAEAIYDHFVTAKDKGEEPDVKYISRTGPNGIKVLGTRYNPVHHITIRNCIVGKVPGGGISAVKADYITIENNHIFETCKYGIYGTSGISLLNLADIDNNTSDYKVIIRGNRSHDNVSLVKWERVRRMSDGNGCIIDFNQNTNDPKLPPYSGRFLVANNLFYRNGGSGLHVFKSDNVDAVNNTVYDNNQNPALKHYSNMFAKNASNVRFLNNIVYAGPGDLIIQPPEDGTVIFANNIYYGDERPYLGVNDRFIDPRLVDVQQDNFHLLPDSPAVDTGVATLAPGTDIKGVERPRGNGFDLGVYESPYASDTPLVDNQLDLEELVVGFNYGEAKVPMGSPEIDGEAEDLWNTAKPIHPEKLIVGDPNLIMASAEARMLWDEKALYVLVVVEDDQLDASASKPYKQDSVEIFIDRNNGKTRYYQADDAQHRVSFQNHYSGPAAERVHSATRITEEGYIVEMAIAWQGQPPAPGDTIGFDLQINDADETGQRETVLMWSTFHDSAHANTAQFGNLTLAP